MKFAIERYKEKRILMSKEHEMVKKQIGTSLMKRTMKEMKRDVIF